MAIKLTAPDLEPLADRNFHAAYLLQPLFPNTLEVTALYLSAQATGWEEETYRLLLVTSTTLELFESRIQEPEWFDRDGLNVRHEGLSRSRSIVPRRSVESIRYTEDGGPYKGIGAPIMRSGYEIMLDRALGSLDQTFQVPLSRKDDPYEGRAVTTPAEDAARLAEALLESLGRATS